jgi:hypothetical protein
LAISRSRGKKLDSKDVAPTTLLEGTKNFIIGIDDCVCLLHPSTAGGKLSAKQVLSAEEIRGARDWVNKLVDSGHYVCFFAARPKRLESATRKWLAEHGFKFHTLLMDKPDALKYHYIDDRHVQATTFGGKFSPLVKKERNIQVFE